MPAERQQSARQRAASERQRWGLGGLLPDSHSSQEDRWRGLEAPECSWAAAAGQAHLPQLWVVTECIPGLPGRKAVSPLLG